MASVMPWTKAPHVGARPKLNLLGHVKSKPPGIMTRTRPRTMRATSLAMSSKLSASVKFTDSLIPMTLRARSPRSRIIAPVPSMYGCFRSGAKNERYAIAGIAKIAAVTT